MEREAPGCCSVASEDSATKRRGMGCGALREPEVTIGWVGLRKVQGDGWLKVEEWASVRCSDRFLLISRTASKPQMGRKPRILMFVSDFSHFLSLDQTTSLNCFLANPLDRK